MVHTETDLPYRPPSPSFPKCRPSSPPSPAPPWSRPYLAGRGSRHIQLSCGTRGHCPLCTHYLLLPPPCLPGLTYPRPSKSAATASQDRIGHLIAATGAHPALPTHCLATAISAAIPSVRCDRSMCYSWPEPPYSGPQLLEPPPCHHPYWQATQGLQPWLCPHNPSDPASRRILHQSSLASTILRTAGAGGVERPHCGQCKGKTVNLCRRMLLTCHSPHSQSRPRGRMRCRGHKPWHNCKLLDYVT